ncbi:hypothetical protein [Tardiphaga robiniae]|uniref:Uncharacterized protein n=1 Tax=Tardiphaga robiniae TaxID=943830 RepID=A0A7G6U2B3_9BRAD|nr:hypothetical protein [Tardiphaga robiniae]QND73145.1 hypothetical protein HB776_19485 [Tardiphaga robiniae]
MTQQEQIVRIQQNQADVRAFVAEQHKLSQAATFESWKLVTIGVIAGAALFGAGAVFMKLFG